MGTRLVLNKKWAGENVDNEEVRRDKEMKDIQYI